jgi:hypothetical protein
VGASIMTKVRYPSGMEYFSPATVDKLVVYRRGDDAVHFEFKDGQSMKGFMEVPANIAVLLARVLLIVAEGYSPEIDTELP